MMEKGFFTISVTFRIQKSKGQTWAVKYFENCILIKGKVAQKIGDRFKPLLFLKRDRDIEATLLRLLIKSCGSLNKENYQPFLLYMLGLNSIHEDFLVTELSAKDYAIIKSMRM
ncbi:MAG: hypothetical protein NXI00_16935 [Cytophagales bacterium]|nr:hypothetical protein [Cytophagales bacterium]